jgi:hypothetical protein
MVMALTNLLGNPGRTIVATTVLLLIFALFAGFLANKSEMPWVLRWICYISPLRCAFPFLFFPSLQPTGTGENAPWECVRGPYTPGIPSHSHSLSLPLSPSHTSSTHMPSLPHSRWSWEALVVNEVRPLSLTLEAINLPSVEFYPGDFFLRTLGVDPTMLTQDIWASVLE